MSPQLECLTLNNTTDLREAFIATPNLQLFNVLYSFNFQTPRPMMGSRQMEIEMDACATNNLLELRTFAENLGENITLSLETNTARAKVCTCIFSIFQQFESKLFSYSISFHVVNYFSFSMKEEVTFQSSLQPVCIKRINLVIQYSFNPRYESFLA